MGRHKAFQVARDAARIDITLVSDIDDKLAHTLLLELEPDLQTAIDKALERLPDGARIGVMAAANATMPLLMNGISI